MLGFKKHSSFTLVGNHILAKMRKFSSQTMCVRFHLLPPSSSTANANNAGQQAEDSEEGKPKDLKA